MSYDTGGTEHVKVVVDFDKCELHGECVMAAPEVFDIGDDSEVVDLLDAEPGEQLRNRVEEAALMCPVAAIRIED
jgi:ferredoxin